MKRRMYCKPRKMRDELSNERKMKKYIAWSVVLGEGLMPEWNPDCDIYEAEDEEEALEEYLDDIEDSLRASYAVRIGGRDYSHKDGEAEFEYEDYQYDPYGEKRILKIKMKEVED